MASLNTLRTRGALFLSIIIGVALIAFLLGDLTTASSIFQGKRNRVGSIDGTNIDYMEFVAANDNMNQVLSAIYGRSATSTEEQDQIRDMVWESYIRRYAYDPGFRKMGISVGDAEQIDMVRGEYISPMISMLFSNPETREYDPAGLEGFVANLDQDPSGRLDAVWQYLKREMVEERSFSKYAALVQNAMFVNDLEVAHGVMAENNLYGGDYVTIPYSSVADSLVTVSSAEIKRYYKEHKSAFKQSPSREVEYAVFTITAPEEEEMNEDGTYSKEYTDALAAAEQSAYNEARNFLALAAGSKAKFDKAVSETGANTRVATINDGDRNVQGLDDSREMVRWSFNSKLGTVSTIFEIGTDYVVAVLTEVQDSEYSSVEDMATDIRTRLRIDKKAAMLAARIKDRSLDDIVSDPAAQTGRFDSVKFNINFRTTYTMPSFGIEPAVMGAISATPQGSVSQPIEGISGVYAVAVDTITDLEYVDAEDEKMNLENEAASSVGQRVMQALRGKSNIKDYRAKFF